MCDDYILPNWNLEIPICFSNNGVSILNYYLIWSYAWLLQFNKECEETVKHILIGLINGAHSRSNIPYHIFIFLSVLTFEMFIFPRKLRNKILCGKIYCMDWRLNNLLFSFHKDYIPCTWIESSLHHHKWTISVVYNIGQPIFVTL